MRALQGQSPAQPKKATLDNATREELVVFVKKQAAKMKGLEKKAKGALTGALVRGLSAR